jgi:hypothetical protein
MRAWLVPTTLSGPDMTVRKAVEGATGGQAEGPFGRIRGGQSCEGGGDGLTFVKAMIQR